MDLKDLFLILGKASCYKNITNFKIKGIACNSRLVQDGFVFVAIPGAKHNGNVFIDEAVRKGSRVVVFQGVLPGQAADAKKNVVFFKVNNARKALADLSAAFYHNPSQKIKVVGITGTNGKTTITYMLEALLKKAKLNPAVIGTVNYRFAGKVFPSKNTTPGVLELQSLLDKMNKAKVKYLAMEVSSHALDQGRTEGVKFHSAIFTNLTQDHLDYHNTLKNYFSAKAKLFYGLLPGSYAIINNDDIYGRKILKNLKVKSFTYGAKTKSDFMAKNIKQGVDNTCFDISFHGKNIPIKTKLIGLHNVYNILACFAWAIAAGLDAKTVQKVFLDFSHVPGRLERVNDPGRISVFVDYAHTEDALKNVISSLRNTTGRKIIVVFGCGGERDKGKRPKMGRVVSLLADYAIITSDNPRSEDPDRIIKDICLGIKKSNYTIVPDRYSAIRESVKKAAQGDIVLIAGKGHENYQIFKDRTIHFDDREVARECLKSLNC